MALANPINKQNPPLSSEEKESLIFWLLRARRMYDTYRRDKTEDYLSFVEYASCFHGISEKHAEEWFLTGDIK